MPTDPTEKARINETMLHQMDMEDYGWVGDRANLSKEAHEKLRQLLKNSIIVGTNDQRIFESLKHSYPNIVNLVERDLTEKARGRSIDFGRKAPAKLGSYLLRVCDEVISVLERAERKEQKMTVDANLDQLREFPALWDLTTLKLEEIFKYKHLDPLDTVPELVAEHLKDVLITLRAEIKNGLNRGPTNLFCTLIAELTANVLEGHIGRPIGRTYDNFRDVHETGVGIEICRVLAEDLYTNLPENERKGGAPDMAKSYRKAVERLKRGG